MNQSPRENRKAGSSNVTAPISKPSKRWTLLYVGNKGRVITLKRFKSFVLLTIVAFAICISILAFLVIRDQSLAEEKRNLQKSIESLQAQVKEFRHEKEIMMARLVLAESRSAKSSGQQNQNTMRGDSENRTSASENSQEPAVQAMAPVNTPAEPQNDADSQTQRPELTLESDEPAPTAPEKSPDENLSVAIEDFNASNETDPAIVQVHFKIKNTSPDPQRVSGHIVVVLKGETIDEPKWVTMPVVSLVSGKPTGRERGYAFGISYFRNMRFKTRTPDTPQAYNQASVYVFSKAGELLLEQDFSVSLSPPKASISVPLPKEEVPDALPVGSR